MYCSKCGNLLNENGTCSNCDVTSSPVTVVNPVSSNGTVLQKTSLAKCAWFAPVAVVVCYLLRMITSTIINSVAIDFYDVFSNVIYSEYYLITGIGYFLLTIVQLLFCYGLFVITFKEINNRGVKVLFLIPYVAYGLAGSVSSVVNQIAQGLWSEPISLDFDVALVSTASEIAYIVATIFTAVISYFLCSNYLSKFDLSEEIKPEEKMVIDSELVITNHSSDVNNGYIQQNITTQKSEKSRGTAAVLCFFLGAFGIHRFYVGKIGTGLLWMFTAGLFGIGAFIDFIIIICGSFKDADDRLL